MRTKVVVVGDMHVVPDETQDCNAVIQLILDVCRTEGIQEVWFSGDQHHNHDLVRLSVLHWWLTAFRALKDQGINSVCLVGNHDQAAPGSNIHAMLAYQGLSYVKVIDRPTVHRNVLMIPYMHDEAEFQRVCAEFGAIDEDGYSEDGYSKIHAPTVFCHQTFDGSTYENGFLASDGFNPNLPPQELLISGHIHTGQEFGKVWYVGAPRWRSLSDANVERSIWVLEFESGKLVKRTPYSTGTVCRQIRHVEDTPDRPVQLPLDGRHQWRIDIKGPPDWCQQRKTELRAAGARVRTFPTQVSSTGRVRESEGVERAFQSYLGVFQSKHGTPTEVLAAMAKERLNV